MRAVSSAVLAAVLSAALPGQHDLVADQVYGTYLDKNNQTQELRLDLYVPTAAGTYPAVVWIHGGGWRSGTRRNPVARFLADRGYVVASISYRLTPVAIWPAQIQDCKGAIRWLRANAARFKIDPSRIGAWGPSAGGHLAACLATMGDVDTVRIGDTVLDLEGTIGGNTSFSSRVQAAANWYGPTDFLQMDQFPSQIVHDSPVSPESQLLGAPVQTVPVLAHSADPTNFVTPSDAPMLISHGSSDPLVPFHQSEILSQACRLGAHTPLRFLPIRNGLHGGSSFSVSDVHGFFNKYLQNLPDVTVSLEATDTTAAEGGNDIGAVRISRTGNTNEALVVRVSLSGTAARGIDYENANSLIQIPASQSSITIPVRPFDDPRAEGTERVHVFLAPTSRYRIAHDADRATVTIGDNDFSPTLPVVSIRAIDATAGENGPNLGRVRVERTTATAQPLDVELRTDGTAASKLDYRKLPPKVTIPANATSVELDIVPVDDERIEVAEYVTLDIVPSPSYALAQERATSIRIDDDDRNTSLPLVSVSAGTPFASESPSRIGEFQLFRVGSTTEALTVTYRLSGRAQPGSDYQAVSGTVTFASGSSDTRVRINPIDDNLPEGRENLVFRLKSGSNYQLGVAWKAELWIDDDDATPQNPSFTIQPGPFTVGSIATVSIIGPPNQAYGLMLGAADTWLPFPIGVFRLDPAGLSFLAAAATNSTGHAIIATPLGNFGPLRGGRPWLQAFRAGAGTFELGKATQVEIRALGR